MSSAEKDSLLFGNAIRSGRLKNGYSVRKAAELIGIDFSYLNDLELNKLGNVPRLEKVKRISDVLGLDYDLLVSYLPYIPKGATALGRLDAAEQKGMVAFYKTCQKEGISIKQGVEILQKSLRA